MNTRKRCLQGLIIGGIRFVVTAALLACARPGKSTVLPRNSETASWSVSAVQTSAGVLSVLTAGPDESPAIVLVNGGPGLTHDYMLDLGYLVHRGFRVVCYDQRGVGSSFVPTQNKYTLTDQVADLEAIRSSLQLPTIHLLGHSWGGILSMAYVAAYPSRVASLILVDSGGPSHADLLEGTANLQNRILNLQKAGIIPSPLPNSEGSDGTMALRAVMPAYFADPRTAPTPALWNTKSNVAVNRMTTESFANYDFRVSLSHFVAPVLVIYGDSDPFGLRMGQRTSESFSPSTLTYRVLKDCGHVPWVECKSNFNETLFAFLDAFAKQ